jgi:Icc-related predicted phosphoesterase
MPTSPPAGAAAIRIAATGDIHCRAANAEATIAAFAALDGEADLALVAGDLTSHGTIEEAEIFREAAAATSVPVFAVLGNHDWQGGVAAEIAELLREGGVELLEREAVTREIAGHEVGIVGSKGFVGGFAPRQLPDFGEPSLRAVYAETTAEANALDTGLREIATCSIRLAVLHYSPVEATLEGEPREIFPFLGSDRLAAPILEHGPDLVVHGHAHDGSAEGLIGSTPIHNVSQPVIGREFKIFELEPSSLGGPIP